MTTLSTEQQTTITDAITKAVGSVTVIYVFGSRAADAVHDGSDIDLAVLASEPLSNTLRWQVQQELAIALRSDVDLVDLLSASTVMRDQVVATGEVLFESDPTQRAEFEMTTLSMYSRFNLERREILEQIGEEGRVYGG